MRWRKSCDPLLGEGVCYAADPFANAHASATRVTALTARRRSTAGASLVACLPGRRPRRVAGSLGRTAREPARARGRPTKRAGALLCRVVVGHLSAPTWDVLTWPSRSPNVAWVEYPCECRGAAGQNGTRSCCSEPDPLVALNEEGSTGRAPHLPLGARDGRDGCARGFTTVNHGQRLRVLHAAYHRHQGTCAASTTRATDASWSAASAARPCIHWPAATTPIAACPSAGSSFQRYI